LNNHNSNATSGYTEVDLLDVFKVIWKEKYKLFGLTLIAAALSAWYALSLPNLYKSKAMLSLSNSGGKGGLGALASQYSGLAEAAGFSLPGGDSGRMEQASELVVSWPFLEQIISKYELEESLVAAIGWNATDDILVYDNDLYNPSFGWVERYGKSQKPTSWKSYSSFREFLAVSIDVKTGFMALSVEHYSPKIAKELVEILTKQLNKHFQQNDITDASNNIDFLERKIAETKITEMREVFFSMVESQTKTLMLAEASDEYLLKTVVPPMVAEEKSAPNRTLLVILGAVIAFILGSLIVLVRYVWSQKNV
jgi:uncharacterized protein involved in exopolysaccharide biosynthesis